MRAWIAEMQKTMAHFDGSQLQDVEEALRSIPGSLCRKGMAAVLLVACDRKLDEATAAARTLAQLYEIRRPRTKVDVEAAVDSYPQIEALAKRFTDKLRPESIAMVAVAGIVGDCGGDLDAAGHFIEALIMVGDESEELVRQRPN